MLAALASGEGPNVPDFTVIQGGGRGGGKDDFHDSNARYHLRRLVIEIARSLARGHDDRQRIKAELATFMEHVNASATPIQDTIERVMASMHDELSADQRQRQWTEGTESIVLASLRLAAETCSHDDAAKGRASSRRSDLDADIDRYVIGKEKSSREWGGSYLAKLLDLHLLGSGKLKSRLKASPRRTKSTPEIEL
jgi:hypothetical protein